jgi:hypothetical protein
LGHLTLIVRKADDAVIGLIPTSNHRNDTITMLEHNEIMIGFSEQVSGFVESHNRDLALFSISCRRNGRGIAGR